MAWEDVRNAEFVIEPLVRGFGHTLGNSVRRVLLSSLRGAAWDQPLQDESMPQMVVS